MLDTYGLTLVTPPAVEPLSTAEARAWLRVEHDAEDALIDALITAARQMIERHYDRQLVAATWRLSLDLFPDWELQLPRGPLLGVSSVQYVDTAGETQTLSPSAYQVDTSRDPGTIQPAYGYVWPATREQGQAVQVTFQAGYGVSAEDVPQAIRLALRFCVAQWYERRGDDLDPGKLTLPGVVESLMLPYWPGRY